MIYFGLRLKALREKKGVNQDVVASAAGVTREMISHYENSGAYPSVEKLILLSKYFHVPSDYLLGLTDSDRFDFTGVTDEQALAVLEIIRQFEELNALQKRDR